MFEWNQTENPIQSELDDSVQHQYSWVFPYSELYNSITINSNINQLYPSHPSKHNAY